MNLCPSCNKQVAEDALLCPDCGALIWRDKLRQLYDQANEAEQKGEWENCLKALTECSALLPRGTRQLSRIQDDIRRVCHIYNAQPPMINQENLEAPDIKAVRSGSLFTVFIASFKSIAKGLTKPKTIISLALWTVCFSIFLGWRAALIFGLMIYIHEMGHLIAIQYYGYRFAWPTFIPFLGAFVLQGKQSKDRFESFVIAIAGSFAGSVASFIILFLNIKYPLPHLLVKVAYINLLINYFNLMPVWILDGARISRQFSRKHFLFLGIGMGILAVIRLNGFLLIMAAAWGVSLLGVGGKKPFQQKPREKGFGKLDFASILLFILLVSASLALQHLKAI